MPRFVYEAISASGSRVSGEVSAATDAMALDRLDKQGLVPIRLREGTQRPPWWARDIHLFGTPGLPNSELQKLVSTLASMLGAGFPLPRAAQFCLDQTTHRGTRQAMRIITDHLEDGGTLAEAILQSGSAIPKRLHAMIAIGEQANHLPQVMAELSELLEAETRVLRDLRSALLYPIILLAMSALVLGVIVFYLAPTLLPIFNSLESAPPRFLAALANAGALVSSNWPIAVLGLAILGFLLVMFRRHIGRFGSALLTHLPITGRYIRQRESLSFAQTLLLMLRGGAQLPEALTAAGEAVGSGAFKELIQKSEADVLAGGRLTPSLSEGKLVDPITLAMIQAGEESDQLPELLGAAVKELQDQTSKSLTQAIQILSPLLTLAIGLGVGGLILSTISAIMELNNIGF